MSLCFAANATYQHLKVIHDIIASLQALHDDIIASYEHTLRVTVFSNLQNLVSLLCNQSHDVKHRNHKTPLRHGRFLHSL